MSETAERFLNGTDYSMATEIIRKRIRTTMCIDDDYKGAYGEGADVFERNLYNKLGESGCRFVTMQPYPFAEEANSDWIGDVDLLILDWKLTKDKKNEFTPALKILDNVLLSENCSLICIYTDEQETDKIYDILETYYMMGYYGGIETIREDIRLFFIENEEELLSLAEMVNGQAMPENALTRKIKQIVEDNPDIKEELINDNRWNEFWKLRYTKEMMLYEIFHHHNYEEISKIGDAEFIRLYSKDKKTFAIKVCNKFVTIMGKHDSQGNHVKPEELITRLAEAVFKVPDHLYHLLHLKYQTEGRESIESISAFINAVPDGILKKLLHKHDNDSAMLDREFREHFMEDASASMILRAENLESNYIEAIANSSREPSTDELVAFNAYYSQVMHPIKWGRKVGFGDIFEIEGYERYTDIGIGQYLLCITAHCDCANVAEVIKNRKCFHFAVGNAAENLNKAVKKPETTSAGMIDFIRKPNGECIAIKWNDYLATLYLTSNIIKSEGIQEVIFKKETMLIHYIGTLKEQYSERIANRLFSHATRVGITYLSSSDEKKKEVT